MINKWLINLFPATDIRHQRLITSISYPGTRDSHKGRKYDCRHPHPSSSRDFLFVMMHQSGSIVVVMIGNGVGMKWASLVSSFIIDLTQKNGKKTDTPHSPPISELTIVVN